MSQAECSGQGQQKVGLQLLAKQGKNVDGNDINVQFDEGMTELEFECKKDHHRPMQMLWCLASCVGDQLLQVQMERVSGEG